MASTALLTPEKQQQLQGFYVVLAIGFVSWLSKTLYEQPLFPLQLESVPWLGSWLFTTICDYYVLAFCLSTIIYSSEGNTLVAVVWILCVNLLGSAFFALYLLFRVYGCVRIEINKIETICDA